MQLPLFTPPSLWKPPPLDSLPSWAGCKRIGIDTETHDPLLKKLGPGVRRGASIIGISFAIEDGPSFYLPVGHSEDNYPRHKVLQYLKDQLSVFKGDLVGANLGYDLDFLLEAGLDFSNVKRFLDVQIADPLINELHFSYSLEAIAERWGAIGKDEAMLREAAEAYKVDPKKNMRELPARFVHKYATTDAEQPLKILRKQEREIDEQDLWDVFNLETDILPELVHIRRRGVRIDTRQLQIVEDWSVKAEKEALDLVYEQTNIRLTVGDVNSSEALAKPLEYIGVSVPKTAKKKRASVNKDLLEKIDHPVARALTRAKKVNKLRTTFVKSIREHMVNGRVHCTFNQLRRTDDGEDGSDSKGARFGRLSCTDPNLQQQPSRDDFANMWRSIYVPDEGGMWASCDFSQQEPRMMVHFAEAAKCRGAKKAGDRYRNDPKADSHTLMSRIIYGYADHEEPSKKHRTEAKIVFLGLGYGMGGAKLAHKLGLPTKWVKSKKSGRMFEVAGPEAQSILDNFNAQAPFVSALNKLCEQAIQTRGYIRTLGGRKCRFPLKENGVEYDWAHKGLNRLIQGSSADQMKIAMRAMKRAGKKLQLQIHDEADLTVYSHREALEIGEIMQSAVTLSVPMRVDVEVGPSWGQLELIA